jgi:riboflavin synthase
MFTGLIEQVGRLERVEPMGGTARFWISAPGMAPDLAEGESVAVDGACLTVERAQGDSFLAFASEETLCRTTLGEARPGREVNLERALRVGDRLGGHLVAGHVDATGVLVSLEPRGEGYLLRAEAPREILAASVSKGSIAVDGISLTLVDVSVGDFTAAIIPQTFRNTSLRARSPGDRVNLESDLIGKYVAKILGARENTGPQRDIRTGTVFDLL